MKNRIQDAIFLGIDFQERLMQAVYESEKIIKNEMILCELAKYYDVPIMFTEQYPKGLGSTVEVLRQYQTEENTFSKVVFQLILTFKREWRNFIEEQLFYQVQKPIFVFIKL